MSLPRIDIKPDVPAEPLATLLLPTLTAPANGTRSTLTCGDPHAEPFRFKCIANLEIESKEQNAMPNLIRSAAASIPVKTAHKFDGVSPHALTRSTRPPPC